MIEIERKYVIEIPNIAELSKMEGYSFSEILQIYLPSVPTETLRIRRRVTDGLVAYTQTKKTRIDKISAHEEERPITADEFYRLANRPKSGTSPINKTRHVFVYLGQTFEIDIYPEWQHTCIMETELPARDTAVSFPPFVRILREVTGERGYSNAAMSERFPKELLVVPFAGDDGK